MYVVHEPVSQQAVSMRLQCVWFLVGAAEASSVLLAPDRNDILTQQDEGYPLQQFAVPL